MAPEARKWQGYNFVKTELRSRRIVQLLVGGLVGAVVVAADKRRLPTAFQPFSILIHLSEWQKRYELKNSLIKSPNYLDISNYIKTPEMTLKAWTKNIARIANAVQVTIWL